MFVCGLNAVGYCRAFREAEADLAAKKREVDKLHPEVEKYGQSLPGLEEQHATRIRCKLPSNVLACSICPFFWQNPVSRPIAW